MILYPTFTEFLGFIKNYPACRPAACKKFLRFQLGQSLITKVNFEESHTCVLILSNSWKDLSDHIKCTIHLRFTNALNSAILDNSLELTFDNLHILKLIFCISIKQTFEWGSMKDSSKMKDS